MNDFLKNESGNVIWFILFTVAMLGFLTAVISRNSSSADQSGDQEGAVLYAVQIMRYAKSIEDTITQMRLSGFSENEISFENASSALDYANSNCDDTSDKNYPYCQIFHANGGGLAYKIPPVSWLDPSLSAQSQWREIIFNGNTCIPGVGPSRDISSCRSDNIDNEDIVLFIPYIKKHTCLEINRKLGIANIGNDAPVDLGCSWGSGSSSRFTGSFQDDLAVNSSISADTSDAFYNQPTGCYKALGSNCGSMQDSYHFYHVVMGR